MEDECAVDRVLAGETPAGVDEDFARQTSSILAAKAPIALRIAAELMDAQAKVSIDEAIQMELGRLVEIFSTKDALGGLSAPPKTKYGFEGR